VGLWCYLLFFFLLFSLIFLESLALVRVWTKVVVMELYLTICAYCRLFISSVGVFLFIFSWYFSFSDSFPVGSHSTPERRTTQSLLELEFHPIACLHNRSRSFGSWKT